MHPIIIDSRRELCWDDFLIDASRTTAALRLHPPRIEDVVMEHDAPWEGDGCNSYSIVKDGDRYRMYYLAWDMRNLHEKRQPARLVFCYAESRDGLQWEKPSLGLHAFDGSKANNILFDPETSILNDMVHVFIDDNPACPADERFKAVGRDRDCGLSCCVSEDGIHFRAGWKMMGSEAGKFDTHNIALWDPQSQGYMAYIRGFHDRPSVYGNDKGWNAKIRDVRWSRSPDFRNWTAPQLLDFGDGEDYALYTNAVQRYARTPHQYIGLPTRYVERKAWTPNFDQLAGAEGRRRVMRGGPRYGLSTTDCVFMTSRDGQRWRRFDEALIRPGIERLNNWVYGDCYPAPALLETPSRLAHAPAELSLFCYENHWRGIPAALRRYTLRMDGFVSRHADYAEQRLVTKPFVFNGNAMEMNFATSARGSLYVTLHGPEQRLTSCELFGDTLDRWVPFDGEIAALSGQEVVMEVALHDADLFSFRFHNVQSPHKGETP